MTGTRTESGEVVMLEMTPEEFAAVVRAVTFHDEHSPEMDRMREEMEAIQDNLF